MSWCLRETEFGHLHPTPSMLRVTAASSAMIGEMTAAKKKSVWQSVRHYSARGGPRLQLCGGGCVGVRGDVLMQANMARKYTMLPLNAMRHQKGREQMRQVRELATVLRWSAYHPLKGDARV